MLQSAARACASRSGTPVAHKLAQTWRKVMPSAEAERGGRAVQLERIAVNVSRNAMPSNSDNSELANRLAMQAAALEADNLDPLGLGRIDSQGMSLVRSLPAMR